MATPGDRVYPLTANYLKDVLFALEGCTLNQRREYLARIQADRDSNRENGIIYQRPNANANQAAATGNDQYGQTDRQRGVAGPGSKYSGQVKNKQKYQPKKKYDTTAAAADAGTTNSSDGPQVDDDREADNSSDTSPTPATLGRSKLSLKI